MTSVALGYTYGSDDVGKVGEGFFSNAKHWRYRVGLTQILTPRWYANMNFEVISDDGYLGSPYRMALVFGAAVPERLPPTRTSRTLQFRTVGEVVSNVSVRAEYRYFWDTWDIAAHTIGVGGLSSGLPSPPHATSTKAARPATIVLAGLARVIKRAVWVKACCIRC